MNKFFASLLLGVCLVCAPSFAGAADDSTAVRLVASTDQVYTAIIEVFKAHKTRIVSHDKELGQIATDCQVTGRVRILGVIDTTECVEFTIVFSKDGDATVVDPGVELKWATSDRRHSGQFLSVNSRLPEKVADFKRVFLKEVNEKLSALSPPERSASAQ